MQGTLPWILFAASYYPDGDIRRQLWQVLDQWLEDQDSALDADEVHRVIAEEKGTDLEPFNLTGEALRTGVFLTRLALASNSVASRFRLVSEDTIGNRGGLVITRSGNSFYSERFALGKNRLIRTKTLFFAPSMMTDVPLRSTYASTLDANLHGDDGGLYLDVHMAALSLIGWDIGGGTYNTLAMALTAQSRIAETGAPLESLGLTIAPISDGIRISATSPESIIRFSSYIVQGRAVLLSGPPRFSLLATLPKEAQGKVPLQLVARDDFASDWMNADGLGAPNIDPDLKKLIAGWAFGPPREII
jgi:hypothetical protein